MCACKLLCLREGTQSSQARHGHPHQLHHSGPQVRLVLISSTLERKKAAAAFSLKCSNFRKMWKAHVTCLQSHTHTHAQTHTRTHTHTITRTHAHTHTHARTHARTHVRTCTHTHTHTYTHIHTHTHMHTHTHTRAHAGLHTSAVSAVLRATLLCMRGGVWLSPNSAPGVVQNGHAPSSTTGQHSPTSKW